MKIGLPATSKLTPVAVIGVTLALLIHRGLTLMVAALFMNEREQTASLFTLVTLVIMAVTDWACIRWRRSLRANGRKFLPELLLLPVWIDATVLTVLLGAKLLELLSRL